MSPQLRIKSSLVAKCCHEMMYIATKTFGRRQYGLAVKAPESRGPELNARSNRQLDLLSVVPSSIFGHACKYPTGLPRQVGIVTLRTTMNS